MEEWQRIPQFPYYEASNLGRIRSERGILTPQLTKTGHYTVSVVKDKKKNTKYVHSLVLYAFVGPRPNGLMCRHKDGNGTNNRLNNLCWDTYSNNTRDAVRKGTHVNSALTVSQVKEIRDLYASGQWTQKQIAIRFDVTQACISNIVNKKRWQHT